MGFVLVVETGSPINQQWRDAIAAALPPGERCRVFDVRGVSLPGRIGQELKPGLPILIHDRRRLYRPGTDDLKLFLDPARMIPLPRPGHE